MKRIVYFETHSTQKTLGPAAVAATRDERKIFAIKMDAPLSAYWVKFFKNAGFSSQVATKHAVIFSNNRIQPDMLPDLDKPSLKEMGITLMGDMIAILRYAKNVVEENSCKKIMVSTTEDLPSSVSQVVAKPGAKKIIAKAPVKPASTTKVKIDVPTKLVKSTTSSTVKPLVAKKKLASVAQPSRMYSDYIDNIQRPKTVVALKRKYDSEEEEEGINGKWVHNEPSKRLKSNAGNVEYKVIMPKGRTVASQKIFKKALEQKKTVFHRLGESMVSSTTNIIESPKSNSPTFNVTGLEKDIFKRNISSVFNRLGNKDNISDEIRIQRNGKVSNASHGILKTCSPILGTKVIATKPVKKIGTMRADEEVYKKAVSERVKPLVKVPNFKASTIKNTSITRKLPIIGKLASETTSIPAKSRLGGSKQVTFNKKDLVNHVRKPGVFSRLGV